jgi:Rab-like protein 5
MDTDWKSHGKFKCRLNRLGFESNLSIRFAAIRKSLDGVTRPSVTLSLTMRAEQPAIGRTDTDIKRDRPSRLHFMHMNTDLKIVFAGPSGSGKTELADLVSAVSKSVQGNVRPTICIRILEFQTSIDVSGLQTNISAQIWDTSGDEKYSSTWKAIANDTDGLVLVYNAFDKNHGRLVESYAKTFGAGLSTGVILVVAHKVGTSDGKPVRPKMPKQIENVQIVICNAAESLDDFFNQFNRFLERVQQAKIRKIEANERALVGDTSSASKPEPAAPEAADNDEIVITDE